MAADRSFFSLAPVSVRKVGFQRSGAPRGIGPSEVASIILKNSPHGPPFQRNLNWCGHGTYGAAIPVGQQLPMLPIMRWWRLNNIWEQGLLWSPKMWMDFISAPEIHGNEPSRFMAISTIFGAVRIALPENLHRHSRMSMNGQHFNQNGRESCPALIVARG